MTLKERVLVGFIERNYLSMPDYFDKKYGISKNYFDFHTVIHERDDFQDESLPDHEDYTTFKKKRLDKFVSLIRNMYKYPEIKEGGPR